MADEIEFIECTQEELARKVRGTSYPGGTRKSTVDELRQYVGSKTLRDRKAGFLRKFFGADEVKASSEFNKCFYSRTRNIRKAEDRLLGKLRSPKYNKQRQSNLDDGDGIVFVLKK